MHDGRENETLGIEAEYGSFSVKAANLAKTTVTYDNPVTETDDAQPVKIQVRSATP